jgi:hypothetical protein
MLEMYFSKSTTTFRDFQKCTLFVLAFHLFLLTSVIPSQATDLPWDPKRYEFFMELLLGDGSAPLPVWSQEKPVPFFVYSLYPEGARLPGTILDVKQSTELALDFGRTACGAGIRDFVFKALKPKDARHHFFVTPNFSKLLESAEFNDLMRWFVESGFYGQQELDELVNSADEQNRITFSIPAVEQSGEIRKLVTVVIPDRAIVPFSAVYTGIIRSYLPGRFSDAFIPSFFNTTGRYYEGEDGRKEPVFGRTAYIADIFMLISLYSGYSERYLKFDKNRLDDKTKYEFFSEIGKILTLNAVMRTDRCKFRH